MKTTICQNKELLTDIYGIKEIHKIYFSLIDSNKKVLQSFQTCKDYCSDLLYDVFALNVKNIDALVSSLMRDGYNQINPYQKSPNGNVLVCYLVGFENVLLELVQDI